MECDVMQPELFPVASLVLILETVIVIVLLIGWIFGARRLEFTLHHRVVYSIILIHSITVGIWMIPRAVLFMGNVIANPLGYWHVILHDTLGIMAVILGIIVGVTFIIRRDMPLKLLKRFRPVMLLILFLWITTFFLGFMVYMVGWESFLPF
jgi:predicted small integral membrane protein